MQKVIIKRKALTVMILFPVAKIVTIRIKINLVVNDFQGLYQLDINNAFLYVDLVEGVYMRLPERYCSKNDTRLCKLVKSSYVKQTTRK